MPVTKRIHFTISGGQNMDGEYDCSSACGLNEDSNAEWTGTGTRDKVTCKRCLTKVAKPKAVPGANKEKPILFSGPMIRAILEGRKTVTRRAVKGHHLPTLSGSGYPGNEWTATAHHHPRHGFNVFGATEAECAAELAMYGDCPYGRRGHRLWVRETFALLGNEDGVCIDWNDRLVKGDERDAARIFKASCTVGDYGLWKVPDKADWKPDTESIEYEGAWRPSIHMPRWASRILLEITGVRVERLQDISEEQALAEGIAKTQDGGYHVEDGKHYFASPIDSFASLWSSVGGDWEANPWVWCVSFKRVTP